MRSRILGQRGSLGVDSFWNGLLWGERGVLAGKRQLDN